MEDYLMKILILSDGFPPIIKGGAEQVAFNLARSFHNLGNEVYVITTVRDKTEVNIFNKDGLKIIRIYSDYHERWRGYLSIYNPQTVKKVEKIIKEINPDVIHVHNIHYHLSYASLKIAKKYCDRVFLTAHDVMLFHYGKLIEFINPNNLSIPETFNYKISPWQQIKRFKKRYNPFRNIIIRHYLKYVDKIFAVSYTLKHALNQNNIENVEVIHNGIDAAQWQIDDNKLRNFKAKHNLFNEKIVFFIGRLSALKGGNNIIKAMKIVTEQVPEAVLLVTGRKDGYAQKMLKLANNENITISFTGWLKGTDLISVYHGSHVVVTPSAYLDPFNLINIEAMACKKPVIGTCFGGIPEIVVNQKTGYIINPLDIKMMAEKIIDLLKNTNKAEQFGQIGYERVKKEFSLKKQTEQYLEWFEKLIISKPR